MNLLKIIFKEKGGRMDNIIAQIDQLKAAVEALATPVTGPTVTDVVTDIKAVVAKYEVVEVPVEEVPAE